MPNGNIAYLLKFALKEAYIDDLINGRLYMNAAGCYHGLPGEQGDPLEASMAPGACLYGYTCLPIYCMYTVRENDIVDNAVKIPIRMIQEFGCADGWIGIVQYDSFACLADRHTTDDGSIYAHGPISYGVPGPKLIREIFEGIPPQSRYQNAQVRISEGVSNHQVESGRMPSYTRRETPWLQN